MNCRQVDQVLSAYLDGELSGQKMLAVRQHCSTCVECRAELEALEATKLAVGRMADEEPNADLEARLVGALRKEVARQQRVRPMWPALVASGAAAAALAWSFLQWQDQKTGTPVATTSTSTEAYQAQSDGSNFFGGPAPVLVSAPKNGR